MTITELDQNLKKLCPIHGVSIGNPKDGNTWRIDFKDSATEMQRIAATEYILAVPVPLNLDLGG